MGEKRQKAAEGNGEYFGPIRLKSKVPWVRYLDFFFVLFSFFQKIYNYTQLYLHLHTPGKIFKKFYDKILVCSRL